MKKFILIIEKFQMILFLALFIGPVSAYSAANRLKNSINPPSDISPLFESIKVLLFIIAIMAFNIALTRFLIKISDKKNS